MRTMRDPMRKFNNYKGVYPYKQMLPAVLNNSVSGKGEKRKQAYCLQEMSDMLVCLKKYEFDQARCSKEVEAFVACNTQHKQILQNEKSQPIATEGRLPTDLVNAQLRKYPQVVLKKD